MQRVLGDITWTIYTKFIISLHVTLNVKAHDLNT